MNTKYLYKSATIFEFVWKMAQHLLEVRSFLELGQSITPSLIRSLGQSHFSSSTCYINMNCCYNGYQEGLDGQDSHHNSWDSHEDGPDIHQEGFFYTILTDHKFCIHGLFLKPKVRKDCNVLYNQFSWKSVHTHVR